MNAIFSCKARSSLFNLLLERSVPVFNVCLTTTKLASTKDLIQAFNHKQGTLEIKIITAFALSPPWDTSIVILQLANKTIAGNWIWNFIFVIVTNIPTTFAYKSNLLRLLDRKIEGEMVLLSESENPFGIF